MRQESAARQQLKQVTFRHLKKLFRENFKREPSRCRYNGFVKGLTYQIGVCLYDADEPRDWAGMICDKHEGGIDIAKNCDWFEGKSSKEDVRAQFHEFLQNSDLPEIAQEYPDIAALMWVLELTGSDLIDEKEGEEEVPVSHLLLPIQLWSKPLPKKAIPVALEFTVDPASAPYLVTSSTSFVWVPEAASNKTVKAAIRTGTKTLGELYRGVVEEVAEKGVELKWENVHPNTPKGVLAAIQHLRYYEFNDIEIMTTPAMLEKHGEVWSKTKGLKEIPISAVQWLPDDWVVAVPQDRSFVGFVSLVGPGSIVGVVHNPSRGIAIAR